MPNNKIIRLPLYSGEQDAEQLKVDLLVHNKISKIYYEHLMVLESILFDEIGPPSKNGGVKVDD